MIIAIDPGGTSGIAIRTDKGELEFTQLHKPSEVYDFVWEWCNRWNQRVDAIICENFSTAGRISRDGLLTVRIIGGVQAIGWIKNIKVYTPEPAQRKMKELEAIQLAPKGHVLRHQRDALMHLLAFEYRKEKGGYN